MIKYSQTFLAFVVVNAVCLVKSAQLTESHFYDEKGHSVQCCQGDDLTGCEIHNGLKHADIKFQSGFVENLPFPDKSFDIVVCTHTLEHILDLKKAIHELKRVAKKQLIIVTPRQKYYYYTLDLHVNFFPIAEPLCQQIGLVDFTCKDIGGDWVYVAKLTD